jgi:Zn-dependent alcohol dehydrogenase
MEMLAAVSRGAGRPFSIEAVSLEAPRDDEVLVRIAGGMGQSVKGVVEGDSEPAVLIPRLIALDREGRFPVDRLVKAYSLDDINQAVADHHSAKCVKAVLIPPAQTV